VSKRITVRRDGARTVADWGMGPRRCAVGRSGIAEKLREGDGVTPIGRWPLRQVFYRPDRVMRPPGSFPLTALSRDDGWCDAPGDPSYNRHVKLPYPASAEQLWRADALYDLILVVGYNDAPVVSGKGSAIFIHVAQRDYAPTDGCVALSQPDLLAALAVLELDAVLDIQG
jgi:L,D-peptidoglycan transpeptidase YkuD (ErfK/YbiS/YcfS/YnhG family)